MDCSLESKQAPKHRNETWAGPDRNWIVNGRPDPWGWAASAVAGLSCHLCSGSVIRCSSWLVGVKKCQHRVAPNLFCAGFEASSYGAFPAALGRGLHALMGLTGLQFF